MDSGLYAAYTGLLARTQALDTAANNLANAGTTGFRAERDYFRGVLADGMGVGGDATSQVGAGVNGYGVLGGSAVDLGQGPLTTTGNPLDVALQGTGFFAIQTAQGVRYTRDGSFLRGSDGTLETGQGEAVLDAAQKPIVVPSGAVEIAANGTISVNGASVGTLGMFDFKSVNGLVQEGTNRFADSDTPVAAAGTTVKQGAVEGANQDAVHGTMQLVLLQRQAEMMQKALTAFDGGFDKTAVEEIARV